MPIKKENRHRYPKNWLEIREQILTRAGHCCEWPGCGLPNYAVGRWRRRDGRDVWEWADRDCRPRSYAEARRIAADLHSDGDDDTRPTIIVLTISHTDQTPEHNQFSNLRALCQRHHLGHDRRYNVRAAYMTRKARANTIELFDMFG
jgi:hypothetical protein